MRPTGSIGVSLLLAALASVAETPYKLPPKEIVEAFDAPLTPEAVVAPTRNAVLLVEVETYPPISLLAQPILRLAGLRVSPRLSARQRTRRFTGLELQRLDGSPARRVALPEGSRIGLPVWSYDGRRFA
ncbi:MAG TPA: S9 family peptidase, partial [Thermoanaerobaculia bacterium]|nr:S9 family peptidase [Thermoanaerobaculia bacterium]